MLDLDPPDHTRLRAVVHKSFTPKIVENIRDRITSLTSGLIVEMREGTIDLIRAYALPIPTTIIAEILGISPADRDRFHRCGRGWKPIRPSDPSAVRQRARGSESAGGAEKYAVNRGDRRTPRLPVRIASSCRSTTISSSFNSLDRTRRAINSRSHRSNTYENDTTTCASCVACRRPNSTQKRRRIRSGHQVGRPRSKFVHPFTKLWWSPSTRSTWRRREERIDASARDVTSPP
jgi:hypothetical protein